jgi:hypothetical protein
MAQRLRLGVVVLLPQRRHGAVRRGGVDEPDGRGAVVGERRCARVRDQEVGLEEHHVAGRLVLGEALDLTGPHPQAATGAEVVLLEVDGVRGGARRREQEQMERGPVWSRQLVRRGDRAQLRERQDLDAERRWGDERHPRRRVSHSHQTVSVAHRSGRLVIGSMTDLHLIDSRIDTGAATLHVQHAGTGAPALVFLHYWADRLGRGIR